MTFVSSCHLSTRSLFFILISLVVWLCVITFTSSIAINEKNDQDDENQRQDREEKILRALLAAKHGAFSLTNFSSDVDDSINIEDNISPSLTPTPSPSLHIPSVTLLSSYDHWATSTSSLSPTDYSRLSRDNQQRIPSWCSYYLGISSLPNHPGRGVFAGRHYNIHDDIEDNPTILIATEDMTMLPALQDYVIPSEDPDYVLLLFGHALLMNHVNIERENVIWNWSPWDNFKNEKYSIQEQQFLSYTNHTDILFRTTKDILPGEELVISYGQEWFQQRRKSNHSTSPASTFSTPTVGESTRAMDSSVDTPPAASPPSPPSHYLPPLFDLPSSSYKRVCLSDVYIAGSRIEGNERGVFAGRRFRRGEVITISPVVALPRKAVEEQSSRNVLMNYCYWDGESSIVFLPLTKMAMMNHQAPGSDNVAMTWFSWKRRHIDHENHYKIVINEHGEEIQIREGVDEDIEITELLSGYTAATRKAHSYSVNDLLRGSSTALLDVAYLALRDIEEDEELYIDYSRDWEDAWNDTMDQAEDDCLKHAKLRKKQLTDEEREYCINERLGTFREFIFLYNGMFSPNWVEDESEEIIYEEQPCTVAAEVSDMDNSYAPTLVSQD